MNTMDRMLIFKVVFVIKEHAFWRSDVGYDNIYQVVYSLDTQIWWLKVIMLFITIVQSQKDYIRDSQNVSISEGVTHIDLTSTKSLEKKPRKSQYSNGIILYFYIYSCSLAWFYMTQMGTEEYFSNISKRFISLTFPWHLVTLLKVKRWNG